MAFEYGMINALSRFVQHLSSTRYGSGTTSCKTRYPTRGSSRAPNGTSAEVFNGYNNKEGNWRSALPWIRGEI